MEKCERQEQNQDLRCKSGPSAKDSVILSGGDHSKKYGVDQQRLQISDLTFRQIPYNSNLCLLEDKVQDRGMYLFPQFHTEAMQWIKEVEMVDSVDDLISSQSIRRYFNAEF